MTSLELALGLGVLVGSGVVGAGVGLVTRSVAGASLSFPAASTARTCTTCWVLSSLNQSSVAAVSTVVCTS